MPKSFRRAYASVPLWLQATGTSQAQLAEMVRVSPSHLSNILSGSRGCSLRIVLKLSQITNVPIENIVTVPGSYANAG